MEMTDRNQRQIRSLAQKFETREADGNLYIDCYFSVFDEPYLLWDDAYELIKPGAFAECLEQDVRALTNHDTTFVLGRTRAGTLALKEDNHGLWGSVTINRDDSDAMNLYARVQRGDVSQCSFGFDIKSEEFVENPDGSVRWIIKDVVLYEVSVCTFPAYAETSVEARKNDLDTIRRREGELWKTKRKERINKCRS